MATILICLLIGVVLPYIWAFSSLPFRKQQFGQPDLAQPRVQADKLTGSGASAVGAQANAWEALIVFAVATLSAFIAGLDPAGSWSLAAIIWVAARVGHGIFYIMGMGILRVLSFLIGVGMSIWIMVMAITV